ncbi:hypothetical protein [Deinococcus soli (ex Cha et al. 2016)]|uniref:Uncharacterized protein n=2 Tax=Deinococcus soli (ex Cha et al. 2016) TaxID=1309411 RepID=A0AAE3XDR1_9DEIO|nr:hypothetical protein [Deinococcus soli (ex Cha et al. 2016)]MDR6218769.1 hypothetical protein [Deinococcus soli (ex Cha et al. 2016)]MDR6328566.1 hypothetical protein [Deinococcus soli (ex Cha et al. 2016)]MDR6751947.1 hypothetical protein [Deinococcus soli (ex Cha et al. 2016)]
MTHPLETNLTVHAIHTHACRVLARLGLTRDVTVRRRRGGLHGYDLTVHDCPPAVGTSQLREDLKAIDGLHVAVTFDPHPQQAGA